MNRHPSRKAALVLALLVCACDTAPRPEPGGSVAAALSGDPDPGFQRAMAPRPFQFPRDHGAHPEYQTEWWYFTGHLAGDDQQFGYQLTFFRQALAPGLPENRGPWASRELFMAHLALSEIDRKRFRAAERLTRGREGLAQASQTGLNVTVEDWSALSEGGLVRLTARDAGLALSLELVLEGPMMLHGDRGLSQKSAAAGNASYYYSMPRLATRGQVETDGQVVAVSGQSWLDREWSTSVLESGQVGWDWFSINLEPDIDLMAFQLRNARGEGVWRSGTIRNGDRVTNLSGEDFTLEPLRYWQSDRTGASYPVAWRISLPPMGIELETRPAFDAQELNLAFRYWEGAIAVEGSREGQVTGGRGYLEMTGYEENRP